MFFEEVLEVLRGRIDALVRDDPPLVHWVFAGMAEGDEFDVARDRGQIEARDPAHARDRVVADAQELLAQNGELGAAGRAGEPADARADRVDRAAAERGDDGVAGFLDPQAALDRLAVLLRQRDDAVASEEVGDASI